MSQSRTDQEKAEHSQKMQAFFNDPPTGCTMRLMKLHFQGSNHLCERS
jgi:hypothetical protein